MYNKEILEIKNPILKKGEFVVVHFNEDGGYDEQFIKIGDGVTPFNELPYGLHDSGNTGGGGDEASVLDSLIDRSITEISSNAESVGDYAFHSCKKLITANFPLLTRINDYAFIECSALTTINFPLVTHIGLQCFSNCSALTVVKFPMVKTIGQYSFNKCSALTTIDFPVATTINPSAFFNCSALTTVILRSETMVTLSNKSAFTSTPITSGTGYIYVPRPLVDTYKSATNWSTYANQFRALEDYTVDGTITGELDESKI